MAVADGVPVPAPDARRRQALHEHDEATVSVWPDVIRRPNLPPIGVHSSSRRPV